MKHPNKGFAKSLVVAEYSRKELRYLGETNLQPKSLTVVNYTLIRNYNPAIYNPSHFHSCLALLVFPLVFNFTGHFFQPCFFAYHLSILVGGTFRMYIILCQSVI